MVQKTRMMLLPDCQENVTMSINLDTVPVFDGRTDRRTEFAKQYRALHALHADAR